jgi:hypothetical protein
VFCFKGKLRAFFSFLYAETTISWNSDSNSAAFFGIFYAHFCMLTEQKSYSMTMKTFYKGQSRHCGQHNGKEILAM